MILPFVGYEQVFYENITTYNTTNYQALIYKGGADRNGVF